MNKVNEPYSIIFADVNVSATTMLIIMRLVTWDWGYDCSKTNTVFDVV